MEKERKITAPEGGEIEKVELVDGVAVVTFREKARKLPKSWEEFCEMFPVEDGECFINTSSEVVEYRAEDLRGEKTDRNLLPDHATAEAVLALCQLIQLRNCYNGDLVPDWKDLTKQKFAIKFTALYDDYITKTIIYQHASMLYFKSQTLCDEFLRNFRPLIEKMRPLYGIKEGGED